MSSTVWVALGVAAKSPPTVAQVVVAQKVWIHVASPSVAAAPSPSEPSASEVPSPQSAVSRRSSTAKGPGNRARHPELQPGTHDLRAGRDVAGDVEGEERPPAPIRRSRRHRDSRRHRSRGRPWGSRRACCRAPAQHDRASCDRGRHTAEGQDARDACDPRDRGGALPAAISNRSPRPIHATLSRKPGDPTPILQPPPNAAVSR